jgi:hypothetical protein
LEENAMRNHLLFLLALAVVPGAYAADKLPPITRFANGVYVGERLPGNIVYTVDAIAGICYATLHKLDGTSSVLIPCQSLKKRPEWATIITWE